MLYFYRRACLPTFGLDPRAPCTKKFTPAVSLRPFIDLAYAQAGPCGSRHNHKLAEIAFFCRIPFGDHPLKLERYRED